MLFIGVFSLTQGVLVGIGRAMCARCMFLILLLFFVSASAEEVVHLSPDDGVVVELRAEAVQAAERRFAPGVCVWNGRLWTPTDTNPPRKVLTEGSITIDGERIPLDVSGLASPWIAPEEMTDKACRLTKLHIGEDGRDICYVLDICFFKGGAMDYAVSWVIYENCSIRSRIEDMGDTYPEWYDKEPLEEDDEPAPVGAAS